MITMIMAVMKARARFFGAPKSGLPAPPPAQRIATGSSEMPITVITVPVTTSGKKRSSRVNTGAIRKPSSPASSRAPKTAASPAVPPSLVPIARIVETAANEVPWTIGWRAPIFQMPRVCNSVARPEMNRPADTR